MTVRELYNNVLVELNKVQAPSLLLEDFVYLINKAVQRYINKKYTFFEMNQQMTDDLRVLLKTAELNQSVDAQNNPIKSFDGGWEYKLPADYIHILNCICVFNKGTVDPLHTCNKQKTKSVNIPASKLDTASWPHTIENYYMKPSAKRPYYYITNINDPSDADHNSDYYRDSNTNEQEEGKRYGNSQIPVIQIKSGDSSPVKVYIDYLRAPKYIDLTIDQLDTIIDQTKDLEFPDYVIHEIINELVTLILENSKDPRVQTQPAVAQSIAPPIGTSK